MLANCEERLQTMTPLFPHYFLLHHVTYCVEVCIQKCPYLLLLSHRVVTGLLCFRLCVSHPAAGGCEVLPCVGMWGLWLAIPAGALG